MALAKFTTRNRSRRQVTPKRALAAGGRSRRGAHAAADDEVFAPPKALKAVSGLLEKTERHTQQKRCMWGRPGSAQSNPIHHK